MKILLHIITAILLFSSTSIYCWPLQHHIIQMISQYLNNTNINNFANPNKIKAIIESYQQGRGISQGLIGIWLLNKYSETQTPSTLYNLNNNWFENTLNTLEKYEKNPSSLSESEITSLNIFTQLLEKIQEPITYANMTVQTDIYSGIQKAIKIQYLSNIKLNLYQKNLKEKIRVASSFIDKEQLINFILALDIENQLENKLIFITYYYPTNENLLTENTTGLFKHNNTYYYYNSNHKQEFITSSIDDLAENIFKETTPSTIVNFEVFEFEQQSTNTNNLPHPDCLLHISLDKNCFFAAINHGMTALVQYYLTSPIGITYTNEKNYLFNGHTALTLAILKRNADIVSLLLQNKKTDVNQPNELLITPLEIAIKNYQSYTYSEKDRKNVEAILTMLFFDKRINLSYEQKKAAIIDSNTMTLLSKSSPQLCQAINNGYLEGNNNEKIYTTIPESTLNNKKIQKLLFNVDKPNKNGLTLLEQATSCFNNHLVQLIIHNVGEQLPGRIIHNALIIAVKNSDDYIFNILAKHPKADLYKLDDGNNLLMTLAIHGTGFGATEIAKKLINNHHFDVNNKRKDGKTAYDLIEEFNNNNKELKLLLLPTHISSVKSSNAFNEPAKNNYYK